VEGLSNDMMHFASLLRYDEEFTKSGCFREQIGHACRVLRVQCDPTVTYILIGELFGVSKSTVTTHLKNFKIYGPLARSPGRLPKLSREQKDAIYDLIKASYEAHRPMSMSDIRHVVVDEWNIPIERVLLYHILLRDKRLRSVHANPMEVPTEKIEGYFDTLQNLITNVPADFVFNFDEMGHQDFANAQQLVCIVPREEASSSSVYYPVSRSGKRITLLARIAADGSFMRPAVVLARKTYEDEILETRLTSEKLELYSQSHSFIDQSIFEDWFCDTFCVDLSRRREQQNYWGPSYLLLDNCSAHHGIRFSNLCNQHNIVPIFLPAHASNQVQPLDLCLFGVTKGQIIRVNNLECANIQSTHVVKVINGFLSAANPNNIVSSFRNGGISVCLNPIDRKLYCKVTRETLRCVMHRLICPPIEENPELQTAPVDLNVEIFIENALERHVEADSQER
jgi:hypothetical protein